MSHDAIIARSTYIIYQPGGTASDVTVTTWAAVQKFIAARQGSVTVYIDDTFASPAPVPAGTTDCEGRVTFESAFGQIAPQPQLSLADNAVLLNPAGFSLFLHVICLGASQPNLQLTSGRVIVVQLGAKIDNQGSQPVVSLAAHQVNGFLFETGGSFQANPSQLVDMPIAPADVALLMFTNSGFQSSNNVITGVVGTNVSLNTDASLANSFIPTNPGFAGALHVSLVDNAQLVSYSPATPGNWTTVPTEVAAALDEIAAGGGDVVAPIGNQKVVAWEHVALDTASMGAPAVGDVPTFNGDGTWHAVPSGAAATEIFTAFATSATNVFAAFAALGIVSMTVSGYGGGGGGGGGAGGALSALNEGGAGGGAGGGALYQSFNIEVDLSHRIDVIVGAGGAFGVGGPGGTDNATNGGDGQTTYLLDFTTSTVLAAFSGASGGQAGQSFGSPAASSGGGASFGGQQYIPFSSTVGFVAAGGPGLAGTAVGTAESGKQNLVASGISPPVGTNLYSGGVGGTNTGGGIGGGAGGGGGAGVGAAGGPGGNGTAGAGDAGGSAAGVSGAGGGGGGGGASDASTPFAGANAGAGGSGLLTTSFLS